MTRKLHVPAGTRFGRLTVLGEAERHHSPSGDTKRQFRCKCDCGGYAVVALNRLRSGATASCGCLQKARAAESQRTHGMSHVPGYHVWCKMLARCLNPNTADYERYGERGIGVCDRWQTSFAAFLSDMGPRPSLSHSIDRKDNDGNYEPGNCRWATRTEQNRNKRTNRLLTFNGQTKCIAEWAEEVGIHHDTLRARLNLGWSVERALTTSTASTEAST